MKIKTLLPPFIAQDKHFKEYFRIMKISLFMLFICVFQSIAVNTEAQNTIIKLETDLISVGQLINQIEKQTDYLVVFRNREVDTERTINIHKKSGKIISYLEDAFEGTDVAYEFENKYILLLKKNSENTDLINRQESKKITGTIRDTKGEPIIGANVVVKGTTNGTITDINGNFSFDIPENAILQITYIGYNPIERKTSSESNIQITMQEDSQALDEVVVIGYGTMKKSDLTGSVSNLKSEKLLDRVSTSVGEALQGRVPGVDVVKNQGTPGGNVKVRIRGDNSITSSNDPLWVVDGIVGAWNINNINPNDIESIEVLKDASATAIYGARGANGVIIVSTKRGFAGKPQISYDGSFSVGKMAKKIELLNAEQFMQIYNEAFDNAIKYDPVGVSQGKHKRVDTKNHPELFHPDGTPIYDTDWQDEVYRTALSHSHQVNIRGGVEKFKFGVFLGIVNEDGLMKNSYYDRYSGRFTLDAELFKWLKLGGSFSLMNSKENLTHRENENMQSVARHTFEALPIMPVKFPDGRYSTVSDFPGWEVENPVKLLEQSEYINNIIQGTGNLSLDIIFSKHLVLKSNLSIDLGSSKTNTYKGKELAAISSTQNGIATISTNFQKYWQNENYITYDNTFNQKHHFTAMLGASWMERSWETSSARSENFSDDFYKWHNLGVGTTLKPSSSNDAYWRLNSYFSRLNYVYDNRYLFTLTGRVDGSSKFGANNKYAFFPSAAFAWRISEEKFMKNVEWINNLKIRTSIGQTGNQEIGQFQSLQFLGAANIILDDDYQTALFKSSFGNSDLKWEKTTQFDIGADINLFNNRISLTADYYYKRTKDLLLSAPIPSTAGVNNVLMNIGELENKGVELSLTTTNIRTKTFDWSTTINWATNKNKVLKLGVNNEDVYPGPTHQIPLSIIRVGEPIGAFWGRVRLGTWGENEAEEAAKYNKKPGDLKFLDLNNDNQINSSDETIIGYASPDFTATFSNTFRYKDFDMSFDLRWVHGSDVYNTTKMTTEDRSTIANNQISVLDAWRPDNQNTMIAERRPTSIAYDNKPDSHKIEDGSFLRLQSLVFGYSLPEKAINKLNISKLRVYFNAQNLFCITKYSGYDPEVKGYAPVFAQNMDFYSYPRPRTFSVGINLTF